MKYRQQHLQPTVTMLIHHQYLQLDLWTTMLLIMAMAPTLPTLPTLPHACLRRPRCQSHVYQNPGTNARIFSLKIRILQLQPVNLLVLSMHLNLSPNPNRHSDSCPHSFTLYPLLPKPQIPAPHPICSYTRQVKVPDMDLDLNPRLSLYLDSKSRSDMVERSPRLSCLLSSVPRII